MGRGEWVGGKGALAAGEFGSEYIMSSHASLKMT